MKTLIQELEALQESVARIRREHAKEIGNTEYTLSDGFRKWHLIDDINNLDEAVTEAINTYDQANGTGAYAPTAQDRRDYAAELRADQMAGR